MSKEIIKICKVHGGLTIDEVGPYRNKIYKNGSRPIHYNCKACRTNKRRSKPRTINASEKYEEINILSEKVKCCYCKNKVSINELNKYQLRSRYPKCKKCEAEMNRHYYILAKYKLTKLEYEQLLHEQHYVCKICRKGETATLNGKTKKLSIDHCHNAEKMVN